MLIVSREFGERISTTEASRVETPAPEEFDGGDTTNSMLSSTLG